MTQEIVQVYREAYYTLQRSQADQAAVERAQEESVARFTAERAAWEFERATLLEK